jgi:prepilin-type N-terminal cleavage/methylation domain-containing protein
MQNKRGMTLVEVVTASVLLGIVMLAILTFISFTTSTTGIALRNSSLHKEMRLIMTHIKSEVVAATDGTVMHAVTTDIIPSHTLTENQALVLFSFTPVGDGAPRYSISTRAHGDAVHTVLVEFEPLPITVTFRLVRDAADNEIGNMLRVTLQSTDPRYPEFRIVDEIFLPNAVATPGSPGAISYRDDLNPANSLSPGWSQNGGDSLLIFTPAPLRP